ncbi:MAG: group 1 truncated hemoglobin [Bdellovibrionales bacterium CG12_big_fil_rev_8_21_14_0_65_38_15]|nr:MAG: group 1 truncated hemoglobin [Bdellovibrionales bacterium CG22_combo_CG10-13_8_21_14_all_38_13]PIQ53493.1 MAG: group 1 truncated hemoglobin [Bdellovibrionales bacterium CG12_big_fil_rev_8_21_14_0_65_38_15]PIR28503.1 MAG: group 1 truncated hemoglobin [Bdellovibrionales bacterium CG11_big_fil_rev_8_21_14_0_20_38_13]
MNEDQIDKSLYDFIGGRDVLEKVHKLFYDKVYKDPWLGKYFSEIDQNVIETQQTDFMSQAMGGPACYCGKLPIAAHKHMLISEELFDLRSTYLKQSLDEVGVSAEGQSRWLKIDQAFKNGIVKKSRDECELRYKTDEILDFKKCA